MAPRHREGEQQQPHHRHGGRHEMDPLLIKEASTLSSLNTKQYTEETMCCGLMTKKQLRKIIPIILGIFACCFVVGIVVWKVNNPIIDVSSESSPSSSSEFSPKKSKKHRKKNSFFRPPIPTTEERIQSYTDHNNKYGYAEYTLGGEFVVHYKNDVINDVEKDGTTAAAAAAAANAAAMDSSSPSSSSGGSAASGSNTGTDTDPDGGDDVEVDKINQDGDDIGDDGGDDGKYNDDDDDGNTNNNDDDVPVDTSSTTTTTKIISSHNRTFGELARVLLPPWHMASVIAVDVSILDDTQPSNHTLKQARQVLKIGRDLLDVFSPCYDDTGTITYKKKMWKKLRNLYSDGYEQVGYYKDLSAAKLVYDEQLWAQRLDDILVWKDKFLDFDRRHDIIKFMVDEIKDPPGGSGSGGFEHKQSHLFWGEESISSHGLPRSTDPATDSFDKLIKTQLQNALSYYDIIVMYDTVLTKEEQEDYHNLRKELRDVVDEFNLLGFGVLLPDPTPSSTKKANKAVKTFKTAVHKIGIFHDEWTAYDKYKTNGEHFEKQQKLELSINEEWTDFKAWMFKVDLRGTIEDLMNELE